MHAYLIVTTNNQLPTSNINKLTKELKVKEILEIPLQKIDDVRVLGRFTKLKLSKPTAIILRNIEGATAEATNAFLKNLEEPQDNLYYILTATSIHKVLPTIVSRCQIITVNSQQTTTNNEEIENFLEMTVGQKLAYLDKIKDRKEAIAFLENLILNYHQKLHQTTDNYGEIAQNIDQIGKILNNIKANGNVTLQLANMAVNAV